MERLYKEAFWRCFGGMAMVSYFIILPLDVIRIVMSFHPIDGLRLAVFIISSAAFLTLIAWVLAWLVPLYANVIDRAERARRLMQICRSGRWVMFYANWPLLLWQKVFKPAGLYVGGFIAVALFALGLWLSSLTKEEEKEDSWIDAWLG